MATFFSGAPGRFARINTATAQLTLPVRVHGNVYPRYTTHRSIVTRISGTNDVNMQVLHAFGDSVYVYIFGDQLSQVRLSGLSFSGCPAPDVAPHGLTSMQEWWDANKASVRVSPILMTIGNKVLRTLLHNMTFEIADLEFGLVQWTASLQGLPPRS